MRAALVGLVLLLGCPSPDVPCPRPEADLLIEQLLLPGPSIGVATVVHLPDGRRLLIEVGNDAHDQVVREAVGAADFVLITHDDEDHAGGADDLADVLDGATDVATLGTHDLGAGVSLEVFLADGVLQLPDGPVDLRAEVPDLDSSDNARSVGAVLRYGSFDWLFAGDLTGGGKGTPDVESAVALRGDDLVEPGSVDLISLSHHGIDSSSNDAWLDWLLPADGARRHALAPTSGGYLSAPDDDVLDRVQARLDGFVWAGAPGSLTDEDHPALKLTGGSVFVQVLTTGSWAVCPTD